MFGQLPHPVQPSVPDPGRVGPTLNIGQIPLRAPPADDLVQFVAMSDPIVVAPVSRFLRQIGPLEQIHCGTAPFAIAGGAEHGSLPVCGRIGALRSDHRRTHADGLGFGAGMDHLVQRETHHLGDHIEHRDGNQRALPGALTAVERGEDSGTGVERGPDIGNRNSGFGGAPGVPVMEHEPPSAWISRS